jgi:pimeloyl-ACP methyl ester carboxylesterase
MPRVKSNGIELEYDTFGSPDDPALLLIMGFTAQMTAWDAEFCERIAGNGYYVIRFDNRDVGLSSRIEGEVDIAIDVLVATATETHGRTAVLRALTRRERDAVEALRVL